MGIKTQNIRKVIIMNYYPSKYHITKTDYSQEEYSTERLPVGIDFSSTQEVRSADVFLNSNLPEKNDEKSAKEQTRENEEQKKKGTKKDCTSAEIINFQKHNRIIRPLRRKISLGSFVSPSQLKEILRKQKKDNSFYRTLDNLQGKSKLLQAIANDFTLLKDFFTNELLIEVEDFCERLFPLLQKALAKKMNKDEVHFTPRKRRGVILAVLRSIGRKIGQEFSESLLTEINNRFNYKRCITIFEVARWENKLIELNFLKRPENPKDLQLKSFFLNSTNHLKHLREKCKEDKQALSILQSIRKTILGFAKTKEKQKALESFIKHKSNDFAARMVIWSLIKFYTQKIFDVQLYSPKDDERWSSLFLLENEKNGLKKQIPIRTWKYITWSEFNHRNDLQELDLFPESEMNNTE
jgi:hypothetical protein